MYIKIFGENEYFDACFMSELVSQAFTVTNAEYKVDFFISGARPDKQRPLSSFALPTSNFDKFL